MGTFYTYFLGDSPNPGPRWDSPLDGAPGGENGPLSFDTTVGLGSWGAGTLTYYVSWIDETRASREYYNVLSGPTYYYQWTASSGGGGGV